MFQKNAKNFGITLLCLGVSTLLAYMFFHFGHKNSANIALIYILALIVIALNTTGYLYGIAASVFCVACVNTIFTYPYFKMDFTLDGYPVTFLGMLAISIVTSTVTTRMKQQKAALDEREHKLAEADKERIRANLLRAVSHDLRTPLTSIIGSSASYLSMRLCYLPAICFLPETNRRRTAGTGIEYQRRFPLAFEYGGKSADCHPDSE